MVPHQGSEPAQTGSPTWHLHPGRSESWRSVGNVPQTGRPARYDQSVAERSRSHICQRTVGEDSLPGYGPVTSANRPVRTRMPGGVGRGREKLPLTRLGIYFIYPLSREDPSFFSFKVSPLVLLCPISRADPPATPTLRPLPEVSRSSPRLSRGRTKRKRPFESWASP